MNSDKLDEEETDLDYAWLLLAAHLILAITTAGHALLNKRDPRAALGWIAACLAYPILGPLLYYLFGINRVRTSAHLLKGKPLKRLKLDYENPDRVGGTQNRVWLPSALENPGLIALARSSAAVTHRELVEANALQPYFNGETAYGEMLYAIAQAQHTVSLATYIFDSKHTGRTFIKALAAARLRGVEVRVLLDGVGELYSFPRAGSLLKQEGVKVARFAPPRLLPPSIHINLRNHRKLLIVDGLIGFTGGMNISDRHLQTTEKKATSDIHFKVEGPIIEQLQAVFDDDWLFAAGESSPLPFKKTVTKGNAICRVITDGPNEDMGKLAMIITGAIALARKRVAIMTPYFLPPPELVNSLQAAALRGVDVCIILPQKSNQPLVHWATRNMLWQLLQYGVRIYYQPPPFAHSKLLLVDDHYAHIGSANIDPRSLRLNFELVVEVFNEDFVTHLHEHFDDIRAKAYEESLSSVDDRWLPERIRDALAWLFSPYL
jgi:cardiolipin synthase